MSKTRMVPTDLRKHAEGQSCTVRVPGWCQGSYGVILAHLRAYGSAGGGQKPPDLVGAHTCFQCHEVLDRRIKTDFTREDLLEMHQAGVVRTLCRLYQQGVISQ